jgi:hypothetical protein
MTARDYRRDIALRTQPERDGPDVWPTPDSLTGLLTRHVLPRLPFGAIWEPAAGPGVLVDAMRGAGRTVVATDIADGTDFLTASPPHGVVALVTNGPFNKLDQFVVRALELLDTDAVQAVTLLLRWDHPMAACRADALSRAYVIDLGCWRPIWLENPTATGRWAFAWITWLHGCCGPPAAYFHRPRA